MTTNEPQAPGLIRLSEIENHLQNHTNQAVSHLCRLDQLRPRLELSIHNKSSIITTTFSCEHFTILQFYLFKVSSRTCLVIFY